MFPYLTNYNWKNVYLSYVIEVKYEGTCYHLFILAMKLSNQNRKINNWGQVEDAFPIFETTLSAITLLKCLICFLNIRSELFVSLCRNRGGELYDHFLKKMFQVITSLFLSSFFQILIILTKRSARIISNSHIANPMPEQTNLSHHCWSKF